MIALFCYQIDKVGLMRPFELEVFFSKWEFSAKHHMTASDVESLDLKSLLAMSDDATKAQFDDLWLGYTETWGAPDLRHEIAATYEHMSDQNILCFAGAGEGIYVVMKCLLTADDHMIVPVPNYQSAETVPLDICDVTGVPMRFAASGNEASGWSLDFDELIAAIQPNTKVISLNFPHNPTGYIPPLEDVMRLIDICREKGIYIFSDEVYRGIELDEADRLPQLADLYEKAISLNVMSKAYGLPGLRIGWIASQDKELLQKAERYKHYLSICNSAPSERLAVIALQQADQILGRNRAILQKNVAKLEALFADWEALFDWTRPKGGCVGYPRYNGPDGGEAFCKDLIEQSGVLLLPSSIYSSELCEPIHHHFRIGFGRDSVFEDGLLALRTHLEQRYPDYR